MAFEIVLGSIGTGLVRSIAGWAEHSARDEKITAFELKQLAETLIRVGIIHAAVALGAQGLGLDVSIIATGAAAFLADKLFHALKAW